MPKTVSPGDIVRPRYTYTIRLSTTPSLYDAITHRFEFGVVLATIDLHDDLSEEMEPYYASLVLDSSEGILGWVDSSRIAAL